MAASKTRYLEKKLQDHLYGNTPYVAPATLYFGLLTDTNTKVQRDSQTFTEVSSTSTGYARKAVVNNTTNFPNSAEGTITINGVSTICSVKINGTVITWDTATASWGQPTAVGVFDAATLGNLLEWFDIDFPQPVAAGNIMSLPANTGMALGLD